jgi:HEAT repeat protein
MPDGVPWEEALGCPWEELFQGTLALVHQGCAYYALLVVTGRYRGRVVYVNLDRCGMPYFVRNADFLSWYERWLDELLWGYEGSWFGFGLPGREDDLVAAVHQPGADANFRKDALSTLSRIPALQPHTLAVIRSTLRDPSPPVREQAAYLLGQHAVVAAAGDIERLLGDEAPVVRKAAVATLARLPGVTWEPAARAALGDDDEGVVFRALCLLKDAHTLRGDDVERLLRSPDPRLRRRALWACDSVAEGPGHAAIPDDFLSDPDKEVRRMAILAVGGRRDRSNAPALLDRLRREADPELLC